MGWFILGLIVGGCIGLFGYALACAADDDMDGKITGEKSAGCSK